MALDRVLDLGQAPRTELEVNTAIAEAVTDDMILDRARSIEIHQIEGSDDRLFSSNGPNLARWNALNRGARPAGWAILQAIDA